MQTLRKFLKTTLLISLFFWLTACGGSGGGGDSDSEVDTSCVLGLAKIGECKI